MTTAQLHADVHETIAIWRRRRMLPQSVWYALTGVGDHDASWFRVEQYMSAWLASRECHSLQRVG
jgi:hypothetical protein